MSYAIRVRDGTTTYLTFLTQLLSNTKTLIMNTSTSYALLLWVPCSKVALTCAKITKIFINIYLEKTTVLHLAKKIQENRQFCYSIDTTSVYNNTYIRSSTVTGLQGKLKPDGVM